MEYFFYCEKEGGLKPSKRIGTIILLSILSVSLIWIFWLSLTPIIDRDGTRFHLPFARLWAENSFLYFRPYFAYYDLNMLNLDWIYMLIFKSGLPDQLTKIIHALFLPAGGFLMFRYFKRKYGLNWGLLAFIFFITIPINIRLASEVYVDLALLFFSTLSLIYFVKWFESDMTSKKYLIISALGAGMAFGTKYNGMVFAFFISLFTALAVSREKKDDKKSVKSILLYVFIIFICVSPWLTRNFINSGNPFFPLFDSVFKSDLSMPDELIKNVSGETAWRIVENNDNFFTLLLLPVRLFFEGEDHNFLKFDGVLNPILLLLLIFLPLRGFRESANGKLCLYLFALFAIIYMTTLYSNNIRVRYFISVIPILVFLNIEVIKYLSKNTNTYFSIFIIPSLFLIYNLIYSINFSGNLHIIEYNPFSKESKTDYMKKYLRQYDNIEFINNNTPRDAVIYEAFTGGRSYYIQRTFFSDTNPLDRYLLSLASEGASKERYQLFFKDLPNCDLKATHLFIKTNDFIQTFFNMNADKMREENKIKLSGFIEFINSLKLLKYDGATFIYEIN